MKIFEAVLPAQHLTYSNKLDSKLVTVRLIRLRDDPQSQIWLEK